MISLVGVAFLTGCCNCKCPVDSGTTFAEDALTPYIKSGELPGVISVFYKDGVQETCCIGYADVTSKRKITLDNGLGENGVRILTPETVKDILAVSTYSRGLDRGYSLGLSAPEKDGEDQWFGHGGAWGTNCMVNWHRKELKLWVCQFRSGPRPWDKVRNEAADLFFNSAIDNSGVDAYTGRMESER